MVAGQVRLRPKAVTNAGSGGKMLGPPILRLSKSAAREENIAHDLGFEAMPALAREQDIERIALAQIAAPGGGLAIRRGGDDVPDHLLPAPAEADELGGEVVEQFGMRRALAERAEVFRRRDESATEEIFPELIHRDARGERVRGIDEPAREVEAIGARTARFQRRQHGEGAGLHFRAGLLVVAADVDVRLALFGRERRGGGLRCLGFFRGVRGERGEKFAALVVRGLGEVAGECGLRGVGAGSSAACRGSRESRRASCSVRAAAQKSSSRGGSASSGRRCGARVPR